LLFQQTSSLHLDLSKPGYLTAHQCDEVTEGLDSDTELDVFIALANFAGDKTVIMVTHREAGLGLVDVVYVYSMEQGVLSKL
jgi:ATP-binding cassette subfamily C protein CydC